jgi:uncharacterized phage-associated protein
MMSFNARKAAQTVAFFVMKNDAKLIYVIKALKLVYLADRESISRFGFPIQMEPRVSMPLGPVNSYTYNHINGEAPPEQDGGWSAFLSDREHHMVGLSDPNLTVDDLDELSDADIEALDAVWNRFGNWDRWDLVNWTHNKANLPEWNDPNGSSRPISVEDIFRAIGAPAPEVQAQAVEDQASIARVLARL